MRASTQTFSPCWPKALARSREAQALGPSTVARREAAGLTLVGPSRLTAALDLDGGESRARARARGLVLEEGARGQHGLEQPPPLAVQAPPLQAVMETIT